MLLMNWLFVDMFIWLQKKLAGFGKLFEYVICKTAASLSGYGKA